MGYSHKVSGINKKTIILVKTHIFVIIFNLLKGPVLPWKLKLFLDSDWTVGGTGVRGGNVVPSCGTFGASSKFTASFSAGTTVSVEDVIEMKTGLF